MSILKVNSLQPANAGSEDYFLARAWVDFTGSGTISIQGSGNVSSLTDLGTGYYDVTLATAMPNGNFASLSTAASSVSNPSDTHSAASSYNTSTVRTRQYSSNTASIDAGQVSCAVFQ